MRRLMLTLAATCLAALCLTAPAQAEFGLSEVDLTIVPANGEPVPQAGSHPFSLTASLGLEFAEEEGKAFTEERLKDAIFKQIAGLVGDTTAYERCSTIDFLAPEPFPNACPIDTAIGVTATSVTEPGGWFGSAMFNLEPPPGVLLRLGFRAQVVNIVVDVGLEREPPYRPVAAASNVPQPLYIFANKTRLWGNPTDPEHDDLRGKCYEQIETLPEGAEFEFESSTGESCGVPSNPEPLLTLPTRCTGANTTSFAIDSWENPGSYLPNGEADLTDPDWLTGAIELHDEEGAPQAFTGCEKLLFTPEISAAPTAKAAQSPTGLDFALTIDDEGLTSAEGTAQSQIRKAVVTLPEGMSANPSIAEGLEVCSQADLARETIDSAPGEGCPQASKIGTIEVESPLVSEVIKGALYQAEPYENEFGSLLAFYFVLRNQNLGIVVKQAAKVEADPNTGRLLATTEDIPQVPFSAFRLHFKEGGRSPLITPRSCGTHEVKAELTPWSGGATVPASSAFELISGPNEGPCPTGGVPPFEPGFEAGTQNNAAGRYSPFYMRFTRKDAEQDMTKISATLPPGVLAKLAGLSKCPEAAIAGARSRTGPHGGLEELQSPSCPASSKIGRTIGGAGVGSQLTYVPGSLYLAGPINGAPLSVVAITPALAGPFDAGTIVVRLALSVDPVTGEGQVDGSRSDPLPHILKGIPLNVRDLRAYTDRPEFTLNATSCAPSRTRATVFGSFLDLLSPADDRPTQVAARYQAADCAALGFKPKLAFKLKGGTKRGGHPSFRATYAPKQSKQANLKGLVVRLPRSAFLDQAHIRTICTRVQFAAEACPKGAKYGEIKAWTPLLEEPLQGPVWLRSSNNKLPDMVFDLHGLVDIEVASRIDSIKGGIRATITDAPDAPLTKVLLQMQGGAKGLIVNSRNLCAAKNRANVALTAQNGRRLDARPAVRAVGCRSGKRSRAGR